MDMSGGFRRPPERRGKNKGNGVPERIRKILPPLLENLGIDTYGKIMLVYPGKEFTSEYSRQIRVAWNRRNMPTIIASDNFADALLVLKDAEFRFNLLVCSRDLPRNVFGALAYENEHSAGRQLAEAALMHNGAMLAIVESGTHFEVYGNGKMHAVAKNMENDPVLAFQKLIIMLMPSGVEEPVKK